MFLITKSFSKRDLLIDIIDKRSKSFNLITTMNRRISPMRGIPEPLNPAGVFSSSPGTAHTLTPQRNVIGATHLRDITPTNHIGRVTPTRAVSAGAQRSSSANKLLKLNKAIFEAHAAIRSMSTSRRRQRRWENANLLSSTGGLLQLELEAELESTVEQNKMLMTYGVVVDIRSAFGELFEERNSDSLETFRSCSERVKHYERVRTKAISSVSEHAWMQVEKRLRSCVKKVIISQPELREFCRSIEAVLVCFAHEGSLPPDVLLASLERCLTAPVELTGDRSLTIALKDSSFHRLLLHAISQFYGARSKSISRKGPKGQGIGKVTQITIPSKMPSSLQSRASLVGFLLMESHDDPGEHKDEDGEEEMDCVKSRECDKSSNHMSSAE